MTYVLYELATGRNHSQQPGPIDNPDVGKWGVKETDKTGVWNELTLDFDAAPVKKIYTKTEFLELFTDDELAGILIAAKSVIEIELFLTKLQLADSVDLDYQPAINAINGMAAAGLLTQDILGAC